MTASSQSITAFILAGSRPGKPDSVALAGGVSHKALLPIGGVPMLLRVIDALQQVPQITRIAVCIENPQIIASILPAGIDVIPARPEGPSASVLAGLARYGTPLLVTTADNALLQPSWVQELFSESHTQADLAVAVATEATVKRDVPNTQRTYIRLADLSFSGCNLFLFRTSVSARVADLWQHVEKNRKHPLRIAWLLGLSILLRALCGKLTRRALYRRIYHLTSAKAELVPLSDGRAAVDVDKPADVVLAEELASTLPTCSVTKTPGK